MGLTPSSQSPKHAEGNPLVRTLLRVLGFVLVLTVWEWVKNGLFDTGWSLLIILGGSIAVLPVVWIGRVMLDAKPTIGHVARITTFVHYDIMILLGAAVIQALKLAQASPGWGIPLPELLSRVLVVTTGVLTALTVANLALRGLGAPFGIALSQRLAVDWMYAWTRNPMVLCTLALLVSAGLWLRSLLFVLWVVVAVLPVMLVYLKVYEERELAIRFGESYLDYRAKTPMLWPRKPKA
jgi:protein-S-isoprenylcysteine O-methyltransferase Ste14